MIVTEWYWHVPSHLMCQWLACQLEQFTNLCYEQSLHHQVSGPTLYVRTKFAVLCSGDIRTFMDQTSVTLAHKEFMKTFRQNKYEQQLITHWYKEHFLYYFLWLCFLFFKFLQFNHSLMFCYYVKQLKLHSLETYKSSSKCHGNKLKVANSVV